MVRKNQSYGKKMKIPFVQEIIARRKVRRTFEKYVTRDAIKKAEEGMKQYPLGKPPEQRHFQFVIVQLDERTPEDVSALLGNVFETCFRHWGVVSNVSVSLLVAYLGQPFEKYDTVENRLALVDDLVRENPNKLRIAHGQCHGLIGNFGSVQRSFWGAFIPDFSGILRKLLEAPPGTVIGIP